MGFGNFLDHAVFVFLAHWRGTGSLFVRDTATWLRVFFEALEIAWHGEPVYEPCPDRRLPVFSSMLAVTRVLGSSGIASKLVFKSVLMPKVVQIDYQRSRTCKA